jgi:hypothetical protein
VGNAVVATGAEMKRNIVETLRTFKNKFHHHLIADLRLQISDWKKHPTDDF